VVTRCNHVLLVHVIGDEAMEKREPGACTPEELLAAISIGASGMVDKFGPP
jgi:hypothetical protein